MPKKCQFRTSSQHGKGQSSLEYLIVTAAMLVIVVIIFGISLFTTDQSIRNRQSSESLDRLVQTADLVYAMGKGTVLFTEVEWPEEVTGITTLHKCKTNLEQAGCPGGESSTNCGNIDCISNTALKLNSSVFGNQLIYVSKARISIKEIGANCTGDSNKFLATGVTYEVKVTGMDTGMVQLERYCG